MISMLEWPFAYAPLLFQFAFSLFSWAARACPSACGAGSQKEWSNPDRILKQQVCAKFGPPDSDEVDPDPTPRPPEEGEGRFVLLTRSGTYNRIDGIAQGVDLIFWITVLARSAGWFHQRQRPDQRYSQGRSQGRSVIACRRCGSVGGPRRPVPALAGRRKRYRCRRRDFAGRSSIKERSRNQSRAVESHVGT
jgi:hypothetical protein